MSPRLLDSRIILLFPAAPRGFTHATYDRHPPPEPLSVASPWRPGARGDDEALTRYLTPSCRQALHQERGACDLDISVTLARGEAGQEVTARARAVERVSLPVIRGLPTRVLCLVLAPDPGISTERLLDLADLARLRAPLYPGQQRPRWRLDGEDKGPLERVLDALLPGHEPIFADPRLFTFTYAALDQDPGDALRYALCATDPASMPPPPERDVARFFERNAFTRWAEAGTTWAFSHYGGAAVHHPDAPGWLGALFQAQYLDLLTWAVAVVASRQRLAAAMRRFGQDSNESYVDWHDMMRHHVTYEQERFSDQDQGRQLVRLWLKVMERDYQHLAHTRALLAIQEKGYCSP